MRTYAVGLLREELDEGEPVAQGDEGEAPRATSFNPLAMGIPVLLVGFFLVFLFPPVGILLFGVAGFLVIWGIVATLFGGRPARRG